MKLTNNEKLFILYSKGHFTKYEDALEVILCDEYDLDKRQLTDLTKLNFIRNLFIKLVENKVINYGNHSVERYLIELLTRSNIDVYKSMYGEIQWTDVNGLYECQLDSVDRKIEEKMKLK